MDDIRIISLVVLVLVGIGSVLLYLITLLRKEESRYFYFHLSVPVFFILVGTLMFLAPRGPALPLWILGVTVILTALLNLAWLIAQRFNIRWLVIALSGSKMPWALRCSFCNKGQRAVSQLIAGPNVYICNDCVKICQSILDEARDPHPEGPAPEGPEPQPSAS